MDGGEGPEVTTGGRGFQGEVVAGVLKGGGREPDEVIVIVELLTGLMEVAEALAEAGGVAWCIDSPTLWKRQ